MKVPDAVFTFLRSAHTIAVVGLSNHPNRPSHGVARYLQQSGFHIIPINPHAESVLGERAYARLEDAAAAERIDIVDVFRRPEAVPEIADSAIRIGARLLWLQEGVTHAEAEQRARDAGLMVVSDRCLLKEHRRMLARDRELDGPVQSREAPPAAEPKGKAV